MVKTETVALPDLSALDVSVRRRMAVAGCLGATWQVRKGVPGGPWTEGAWWLLDPPPAIHPLAILENGKLRTYPYLKFFENDPAAWGVLLSTELHGYDTDAERGVRCWFYRDEEMRLRHYGPYEATLPAACVSAVLVKFGAYCDELRTPYA